MVAPRLGPLGKDEPSGAGLCSHSAGDKGLGSVGRKHSFALMGQDQACS